MSTDSNGHNIPTLLCCTKITSFNVRCVPTSFITLKLEWQVFSFLKDQIPQLQLSLFRWCYNSWKMCFRKLSQSIPHWQITLMIIFTFDILKMMIFLDILLFLSHKDVVIFCVFHFVLHFCDFSAFSLFVSPALAGKTHRDHFVLCCLLLSHFVLCCLLLSVDDVVVVCCVNRLTFGSNFHWWISTKVGS